MKDQFRCVGGRDAVTPQLLAQCFERMSAWVTITKEALQAEFPSFEALSAFSVLQLRPKLDATVVKRDLTKVCKIFGEEPELPQLCRSFCDVEYTASKRRPLVFLLQIYIFRLRSSSYVSMSIVHCHVNCLVQFPFCHSVPQETGSLTRSLWPTSKPGSMPLKEGKQRSPIQFW